MSRERGDIENDIEFVDTCIEDDEESLVEWRMQREVLAQELVECMTPVEG